MKQPERMNAENKGGSSCPLGFKLIHAVSSDSQERFLALNATQYRQISRAVASPKYSPPRERFLPCCLARDEIYKAPTRRLRERGIMSRNLGALAVAVLISFPSDLRAQVPQLINYQGNVTVTGTNFDGPG